MEWIEIPFEYWLAVSIIVSTLAVEWIEIIIFYNTAAPRPVSTLAVEWIEIVVVHFASGVYTGLHPRGGVD